MNALPAHDPPLPWVQPDWLVKANAWIRTRLDEQGLTLTDEIEQPHVRWWSTVLRVPTNQGDLWFKANAAPHAFEAALLAILERVRPGSVPELVAHDADRGWILMRDGGTRLRELVTSAADLYRYEEVLPSYAELQLAVAPHVDEFLAAGVPDERLAVLPAHLARLLDDSGALLVDRENGVTGEEHDRLRALLPEFADRCERLAAYGIPEALRALRLTGGAHHSRRPCSLHRHSGALAQLVPVHLRARTGVPHPRRGRRPVRAQADPRPRPARQLVLGALDQLDPVAVGIPHKTQA